ncbi:unnamed protein product [Paramecium sonneborni]|uniref:Uncharacterized protein n=1 Tax=Paramecium sonneborni TaxID=65129 RepID=A0A8S1RTU8_9CILI|nr:unnamed protein product [Paramecium sonneborni]
MHMSFERYAETNVLAILIGQNNRNQKERKQILKHKEKFLVIKQLNFQKIIQWLLWKLVHLMEQMQIQYFLDLLMRNLLINQQTVKQDQSLQQQMQSRNNMQIQQSQ